MNDFNAIFETDVDQDDFLSFITSHRIRPTAYTVSNRDDSVRVSVESRGGFKWAIIQNGFALNKEYGWEYEPLPSNRDDDYLKRTRFSLDEALNRAHYYVNHGHKAWISGTT